jgi:tetratricopeptide (TPR) repeat protein
MIVKNEEDNLPACLDSVSDVFDEIIVVDTGSDDQTRQLAAVRGAHVSEFPWIGDFAAARNACLERATGDWIFWLDADDRLDPSNRDKLKNLLKTLSDKHVAYAMKCLCVPRDNGDAGTVVDHIRLFRRRPDVRWEFRVHEQILGAIRRSGGTVRKADIVIRHVGYVDPVVRRRKLERDLKLLEQEEALRPGHPFTLFNLGQVLREMGRPFDAVPVLRRSLEQSHPNDSIVRKLFALLAQCLRELNRTEESLAAVNQGLEACPDDSELLFARGILLMSQGDMIGAEGCYRRLLATSDDATFTSVAEGLRGHQARNNLAAVLQKQGRMDEAEMQWRSALAERPDYPPSMLGLAELFLGQERWNELEDHLMKWEKQRPHDPAIAVVRAKGQMARREFGAARELLDGVLTRAPKDRWVWAVLSHCLLQEGRDLAAAEKTLRTLLELDPTNSEAKRNLEILLRQTRKVT